MRMAAIVFLIISTCISGCGPRVVIVKSANPPAWVDRMPKTRNKLCAVGYSGPTFYQQDCVKNAAENARGLLAETISATIKTITIDISDGTRGSFSRDIFVEGSETASEAVLKGSEIRSQWVDFAGARGAPNGCYTFVCIDPDKPIDSLVDKLEEKKIPPKTVEKVRANAQAAFDELEKEEQKKEATNTAPMVTPEQPEKKAIQEEETSPDTAPSPESGNSPDSTSVPQ